MSSVRSPFATQWGLVLTLLVVPAWSGEGPAPSRVIAYEPPERGAQCNQDRWIYNNVFSRFGGEAGVFVEFGARDGLKHSNSLFYEKTLGWEGLLIEAGGDDWDGLKMNRRCTLNGHGGCAHAALSDKDDQEVYHHECPGGPCRQIVPHGEAFVDNLARPVRTVTLNRALQRRDVKTIDLLCADCEGCEWKALKAFDFASFQPKVILLERQRSKDGMLSSTMIDLRNLLHAAGYFELTDADLKVPFVFQDSFFLRGDLKSKLPHPCLDHLEVTWPLPCVADDMPRGAKCTRRGIWAEHALNHSLAG